MRKPVWVVLALAVGIVAGAAGMAAIQDSPELEASLAVTEAPVEAAPAPEPRERVLLAWTSGGLPPELPAQVDALGAVRRSTVVDGDTVNLVGSAGADGQPIDTVTDARSIPLDALAIDPATYAPFFDKAAQAEFRALQPGEVLLGATSSLLRRSGPGAVLQLDNGASVTVAGVVDDEVVGAAELVVDRATAAGVGIATPRFLLISYRGDRVTLEREINALLPPKVGARYRSPDETPYLRHGDAVLPQALIKARFGEFAYQPPTAGRFFEVDPAWRAEHIVQAKVPILGKIGECHRAIVPTIEGALRELEQRNLAFLIDRNGFRGCFQPSVIEGAGISRHSWGVAIDLNFTKNPTGVASAVDPRVVEVMDRWGFTSGAEWLVRDAGHFEYLRPPRH